MESWASRPLTSWGHLSKIPISQSLSSLICEMGIVLPAHRAPVWQVIAQEEAYSLRGAGRGRLVSGVRIPL